MEIDDTGWVQYFIAQEYLKTVNLRRSKSSTTTIHWTLLINQQFVFLTVPFYTSNTIHLAALGILWQSNDGGDRLPRDFRRLQLNMFNQLLSPQLTGLLGPRDI